jgi:hypothetical protein
MHGCTTGSPDSRLSSYGHLIEWCLGDGAEFTRCDGSVYDLYRREQAGWDEIQSP